MTCVCDTLFRGPKVTLRPRDHLSQESALNYAHIASNASLIEFCQRAAQTEFIGFDTEFVSEDTFQSQLCLIQVAAGAEFVVIDPLAVKDLRPFWQLLSQPGHVTVAHAGREELLFSVRATDQTPHQLFDLQIAAALVGLEYPAAYGTLIQRLLGTTLSKGETRTDWRKRPLSDSQLEYAVQDVIYLRPLYDKLNERLKSLGRLAWLETEMASWQSRIVAREQQENWRRVSGSNGLRQRSLAILRELWRWRNGEAQRRNMPVKRVLRDDLIVELARRQTADVKRIQAVRGMERGDLRRNVSHLAAAIARALDLPADQLPERGGKPTFNQLATIGQFTHTALNSICRSEQIAPGIVATVDDVRDFVAYHCGFGRPPGGLPALTQGWRAEVVGHRLQQLLAGQTTIRVRDPLADNPLVFETLADRRETDIRQQHD